MTGAPGHSPSSRNAIGSAAFVKKRRHQYLPAEANRRPIHEHHGFVPEKYKRQITNRNVAAGFPVKALISTRLFADELLSIHQHWRIRALPAPSECCLLGVPPLSVRCDQTADAAYTRNSQTGHARTTVVPRSNTSHQ